MTARDEFDRTFTAWLVDTRPTTPPEGLLDDVLTQLAATERRREWLIPDRWTWSGRARRLTTAARPALLLALVALLVVALVLVTLLAGGRRPAPPFGLTRPGWITIDTADGIQVTHIDGTNPHVLVPAEGQSLSPTWSRDGLHVAFWHRVANPGPWQLVVVDADGGDRQVVADGVTLQERESTLNQPSNITWSPDSRRMAYAADADGGSAIFTVDRDVYGPVRITDPSLKAVDPAWSPDGTRIAFESSAKLRLQLVNADGTGERSFDDLGETTLWPDWSPDGALIAVTVWDPTTEQTDVWTVAPDGTGARNVSRDPAADMSPAWSPDGTRLAWARAPADESARAYVVVASRDGERVVTLRVPTDLAPPAWSPDGTRLFSYVADEHMDFYEVVVLDPDGIAPPVRIPTQGNVGNGSWQRDAP
jgi:Tol biopolymer transport system component